MPLAAAARHNLFLAVKEALNNAAKHSGASEVSLRVSCSEQRLRLEVEDNGRGFDSALAGQRNGLENLRQRLASLGGAAEIVSQPGRGTRVRLEYPLGGE